MQELFLILIAAISVVFLWILWARQGLVHHLRSFQRRDLLLRRDLQKRRDMVPYLLESFRAKREVTPEWTALLEQRKAFHAPGLSSMNAELAYESELEAFIMSHDLTDVNYLEAERNINKLGETIERAKQAWQAEYDAFVKLRKRFPYSVASAMFGVRI